MKRLSLTLCSAILLGSTALAGSAAAEEVVLRAASAFQLGTMIYAPFEDFVKTVNEKGKGILHIDVIGGPDAMPPFEIGNALRGGVVDLAYTTAVYHANLVPEGLALTLTNRSMKELRDNGGYALMDNLHMKKAGIHWLGRIMQNMQYHIFLSEYPTDLKFKNLKIRSAPTYQSFFTGLGITPIQTAGGEVFTALERRIIDGYAWPTVGIFDMGWQEKTKARIDPGFYQVETGVYFSGKVWEKLGEPQKKFLEEQMIAYEDNAPQKFAELEKAEVKRQEGAGIRAYDLPKEEAAAFVKMSQDEGWKPVLAASPKEGAKLRELFVK